VHLVGFIIRIYHDARSPECQIVMPQLQQCTLIRWVHKRDGISPLRKVLVCQVAGCSNALSY